MEHLSCVTGIDPVQIRLDNMLKDGDKLISGDNFKGDNPLPEIIKDLKEKSEFDARKSKIDAFNRQNLWKKRGISLIPVKYAHILPQTFFYSKLSVYHDDGTVAVSHAGIEMGQGINTKVAQVVAKELGIPMDMVCVKRANNMTSPNATATDGSTGSEGVCSVRISCHGITKK